MSKAKYPAIAPVASIHLGALCGIAGYVYIIEESLLLNCKIGAEKELLLQSPFGQILISLCHRLIANSDG